MSVEKRLLRSPLARLRAHLGSASKVAASLGCSRVHLYNIESGRSMPSLELAARMAALYGVSGEELIKSVRKARRELLRRQIENA